MADNKQNKKLKDLDNSIDSLLYDLNKEDIKERDRIEDIREKVSNINTNYSNITKSPNTLEFLTQTALADINTKQRKFNKNNINSTKKIKEQISKLMEEGSVASILMEEKDRLDRYNDYRLVDSFIPQVSRCMDLYRDSILAPDDLTKKSINITYDDKNISENDIAKIEANIKEMKDKFKLDKKVKHWLRDALVTGDSFIAVLKIDEEINKMMLSEKHSLAKILPKQKQNILTENEVFEYSNEELKLLEDVFLEAKEDNDKKSSMSFNDLKKDIVEKINNNIIYISDPEKDLDRVQNMGLMNKKFTEVQMNGAVLKQLLPDKTIKLMLDDLCLGYLYIEKYDINSETGSEGFGLNVSQMNPENNTIASSEFLSIRNNSNGNDTLKNKLLTDIFVKGISKKLDKKIIYDNKQFKEFIYQLIKKDYLLDKKIKITYYEAEQVKHYAVDSDDTYGVSKLSKVMFFARIFLATMLTETMQKVARGRDKRVIYVETGLDEDIEGSIQSVVRDWKTKEIQADDLTSITSIFNQVGAFEDYFIPKIDGETPIDFETISGMDVNMDSDFIQYILKSIISGIGIPATYTDASNDIDFSRSLVMQNSTFVREIVSKQGDAEEFFSDIFRKLYEYEFGSEEIIGFSIDNLMVKLPTPEFLNVNNINEQIGNHTTTIEFIVNTYFGDGGGDEEGLEEIKQEFKKEVTKDLVSSIDWNKYDELLESCQKNFIKNKLEKKVYKGNSNDDMGDDDMGDDDF